jgi:rhodanese-related sulfurtransferase
MSRRLTGAFLAVLAIGLAVSAAPQIEADSDTYDFGTILEGYAIEHTFVLTNTGDETLLIRDVQVTCGCTTTELTTNELAPGQSVELHALVGTSGFGGRDITKTIKVFTNDPRYNDGIGIEYYGLDITGTVLRAEPYHKTTEQLYLDSYVLVDLRPEDEYATGHLIGAVNIQPSDLGATLDPLELPGSSILFVYDETGEDAYAVADDLVSAGYLFARSFTGGLSGWVRAYGSQYVYPPVEGVTYDPPLPKPEDEDDEGADANVLDPTYLRSTLYVLIDLREPEAFDEGHLVGAVNIPSGELSLQTLTDRVGTLPRDARIILYDETSLISDDKVQELIDAGYPNAKSLLGGFGYWQQAYGDELVWQETP